MMTNPPYKVLDPFCGSGGFLVAVDLMYIDPPFNSNANYSKILAVFLITLKISIATCGTIAFPSA